MNFESKLKKLMNELGLSQSKVSELTGISKSNISQYINGKHEPSKERKKEIAVALGVQEDYFNQFEATAIVQHDGIINLHPKDVAKLLHKSKDFVEQGLQQGRFPWGYAVKMKNWSYLINGEKFAKCEGIELPIVQQQDGGKNV